MVYFRRTQPELIMSRIDYRAITSVNPELSADLSQEALELAERVNRKLQEQSGGYQVVPEVGVVKRDEAAAGVEVKP